MCLTGAAKFLIVQAKTNSTTIFDSTIPEHNVFPTEQEIIEISETLTQTFSARQSLLRDHSNRNDPSYKQIWKTSSHLVPQRIIGQGSFGSVWLAEGHGKELFAVKVTRLEEPIIKDTVLETSSTWRHANVVRYFDSWREPEQISAHENEPTSTTLFIKMELCDGDLAQFLDKEKHQLNPPLKMDIIRQVSSGLDYLHSEVKVIHGDLKPANILFKMLQKDVTIFKIGDFGLSRNLEGNDSLVSTPLYRAPEVEEVLHNYTSASDIYSAGLIFCEVLHNFERDEKRAVFHLIKYKGGQDVELLSCFLEKLNLVGDNLSSVWDSGVGQVLAKMLNPVGNQRPTAGEIVGYLKSINKLEDNSLGFT